MVLIEIHHYTCAISHSCQEDMRLKDLKNFFSKKVELTLDNVVDVIYVTRITSESTTVFVSASACNPSFGQGYAHQLIGEKAMTNQNATTIASNIVADENGNINCTNCSVCSDHSDCSECTEGMLFMQELLERHGMLFLSRLQ